MSSDVGDPGSTSALGGALRAHALRLMTLLAQLGEPVAGSRRPPLTETALERELIATVAAQLDRIGAALQGLVTKGIERSSRHRDLGEVANRYDLDIDGTRVSERQGPSRVDPTSRLQARKHVQELLGRVAAGQGRDVALLSRELEASQAVLKALTERARDQPS